MLEVLEEERRFSSEERNNQGKKKLLNSPFISVLSSVCSQSVSTGSVDMSDVM